MCKSQKGKIDCIYGISAFSLSFSFPRDEGTPPHFIKPKYYLNPYQCLDDREEEK